MSRLRILFVAAEVAPYAKTGGLADVAAALPRALARGGHDVRVVIPYYRRVAESGVTADVAGKMSEIDVPIGARRYRYGVREGELPKSSVPLWFVDCPELFDREDLYCGDDDRVRFAMLASAALVTCQWAGFAPDIVHCNDWHTGLVPLLLESQLSWDRLFERTRTVLTIHNIGYQGVFGADTVQLLGLQDQRQLLHQDDLRDGRVGFLKTGILYANALTTVSETYAREIRTAEFGAGLEDLLEARKDSLFGIVNGVDYADWDPASDELIPHRYTREDLSGKAENKAALRGHFGLASEDVPLLGIVSRLIGQKGFELLPDILPVLLHRGELQLAVLGSGEPKYESYFAWLRDAFPGSVGFHQGYSDELAHWIEAGADAFLMPSRYEPCGLNQMYSLKYGTVPVVRRTGGLADTVRPWHPDSREGTGFLFDEFRPEALLGAIRDATSVFRDQKAWRRLMRNGMAEDWSWDRQVRRYVDLYDRLVPAIPNDTG